MIREVDITFSNPFKKRIEYFINENSVGFLEYSLIYDRIEIDNIKVNEEFQNQGIGTKLIEYLIDLANKNQIINITLEVRVSNLVARNLYKKFGFIEISVRKYYYGDEDGILMERTIRS